MAARLVAAAFGSCLNVCPGVVTNCASLVNCPGNVAGGRHGAAPYLLLPLPDEPPGLEVVPELRPRTPLNIERHMAFVDPFALPR